MLFDNTASLVEDKIVLGPGGPWEIFFLVSEVVEGARKQHFNQAYESMHYALRCVGLACVRAIVGRRLGWRKINSPRFIVVRRSGKPCGAMLLKEVPAEDGTPTLLIEYLAVASSARREGIGRMLVEYAKRRSPAGGVECYCTEASRAMQRLLKSRGFHRTHRSKEIFLANDDRLSLPSRWHWRA